MTRELESPVRPLGSRAPLERILRIHRRVQAGEAPNATTLAADLEVTTKSIYRDIDFMRDRLGLPLEYVAARRGFVYTSEVSSFPTLQISEGELFALLVAEKALQQYRGTPFEKPLLSTLRKMAAALPETISVSWADWDQTISFRTSAEQVLDLGVFEALSRAVVRREQLELTYRKPGRKATEIRIVDPFHLANINGDWFLFAYCHLRKDLRTFAPARIQSAKPTGRTFNRPPKFSLERRLRDSFGVVSGTERYEVTIRFDDFAADYIREKRWHPSQRIHELPDGGVEVRFKLSSWLEVARWALGWGRHARVMAPPELVAHVRETARRILEQHGVA